jgi:hypothetical protein
MKNVTLFLLFTCIVMCLTQNLAAQKVIETPYFENLSGNEVCGKPNCNPSIGTWAPIKEGYLWDEDITSILVVPSRKQYMKITLV